MSHKEHSLLCSPYFQGSLALLFKVSHLPGSLLRPLRLQRYEATNQICLGVVHHRFPACSCTETCKYTKTKSYQDQAHSIGQSPNTY